MSESNKQPDPEFIASQLRKPSGDYAGEVGENMNRVNEALFDLTLETMELENKEEVLEIGFGTGSFMDRLFNAAGELKVCGIDFSDEMVKMATENNKYFIEAGNLTISRGRSDDIPYSDSTFDKVYCNMVIYFWDHPEKHLREVHRVLKPGGKFYTGMRSRESMQVFPFVEYGFNLYESGEWKRILSENGFHITDQKVKKDPGLDFKEQELRLESHCIVASKV